MFQLNGAFIRENNIVEVFIASKLLLAPYQTLPFVQLQNILAASDIASSQCNFFKYAQQLAIQLYLKISVVVIDITITTYYKFINIYYKHALLVAIQSLHVVVCDLTYQFIAKLDFCMQTQWFLFNLRFKCSINSRENHMQKAFSYHKPEHKTMNLQFSF